LIRFLLIDIVWIQLEKQIFNQNCLSFFHQFITVSTNKLDYSFCLM